MYIDEVKIRNFLKENNLSKEQVASVQEVGRGAFNVNYQIRTGKGVKYLFRFVLHSMRDQIKNMAEYETRVLVNLEEFPFSPKVFLCDQSKKYFPYNLIVEEYFPGDTMIKNMIDPVRQTIDCLPMIVKLHKAGNTEGLIPQSDTVSVNLIKRRLEFFKINNSFLSDTLDENMEVIEKFINRCNKVFDKKVFVHGDLHAENIICSSDDRLFLVDWQSAFVGDPIFDIATLVWDFEWKYFIGKPLSAKQKKEIVKKYCRLMNYDVEKIESQIGLATIFLDLDILLRIEYLYTIFSNSKKTLAIEKDDAKFILDKRISPGRKMMVSRESLENIIFKMRKLA